MKTKHKDQLGNTIEINTPPQRIISLVPSQTELLFDLGLDEEIAGITRFCVLPEDKCRKKPKIGGTKKFNFERIEALQPDLVIGNKEENYPEGIQKLREKYPVWMSDLITLEDALGMIEAVGKITGKEPAANNLIAAIRKGFRQLSDFPPIRAAYFIWKNPYMAAGNNTFIHEMMKQCGLINVFADLARYPEVTETRIAAAKPQVILLSSEPFPFGEKEVKEFAALFPTVKIIRVDGRMFSWYGNRLRHSAGYFLSLRKELAK